MRSSITLFISLFTTLLAIINPLEAVPVFLNLLQGQDDATHSRVARKSCIYAMGLMFFFLLFGTLLLRLFGVPLSMVRVVGGIILTKIGFELFGGDSAKFAPAGGAAGSADDVAFIPLAMPIMFGPGGIATIISIAATAHVRGRLAESFVASSLAIVATMATTWLALAYADRILVKVGAKGIDVATRITGFFVSAIGMGLVFNGVVEFLQSYGIMTAKAIGS